MKKSNIRYAIEHNGLRYRVIEIRPRRFLFWKWESRRPLGKYLPGTACWVPVYYETNEQATVRRDAMQRLHDLETKWGLVR